MPTRTCASAPPYGERELDDARRRPCRRACGVSAAASDGHSPVEGAVGPASPSCGLCAPLVTPWAAAAAGASPWMLRAAPRVGLPVAPRAALSSVTSAGRADGGGGTGQGAGVAAPGGLAPVALAVAAAMALTAWPPEPRLSEWAAGASLTVPAGVTLPLKVLRPWAYGRHES